MNTSKPPEVFVLPMDPAMEAFFVAVALELGTRTGLSEPQSGLLPGAATAERVREMAVHQLQVAEFMKKHPGAPAVFAKLKRAQYEATTLMKNRAVGEYFFWDEMAYAYIMWCRDQPGA